MNNTSLFALNYGLSLPSEFGDGSKCYFHTNENIKEFMEHHSPKGKNILCVAGSGDQRLNAFFYGAKKVTCFDINSLAKHQLALSNGKILALNYQQMCDFMTSEENRFVYYQKIKPFLSQEDKKLFQIVFQNRQENFYYSTVPTLTKLQRINGYYQENNYSSFQNILKEKEIHFIQSDVLHLMKHLKENYDMILLSNLNDSIDTFFHDKENDIEKLKAYRSFIKDLSKYLNNEGIIQVGYSYAKHPKRKQNAFDNRYLREQVFTTGEFQTETVSSYDSSGKVDTIITYQKKL